MLTIFAAPWVMASNFSGDWTRPRDSVSLLAISECMDGVSDLALVFRIAHDSAKEIRIWAGEAKKPK